MSGSSYIQNICEVKSFRVSNRCYLYLLYVEAGPDLIPCLCILSLKRDKKRGETEKERFPVLSVSQYLPCVLSVCPLGVLLALSSRRDHLAPLARHVWFGCECFAFCGRASELQYRQKNGALSHSQEIQSEIVVFSAMCAFRGEPKPNLWKTSTIAVTDRKGTGSSLLPTATFSSLWAIIM